MKRKPLVMALLGLGFGMMTSVQAADKTDRIAQLEAQLKALQEEVAALKKSSSAEITQVKDQVAAQGKEAVVIGDIPNSYRLAGTDTSMRVYGIAEMNLVHETKGTNAGNDYSTFMPYAPLNGTADGNRKGQTYLHARTSRFGIEGATPTRYGLLSAKVEGDFNNDPRTGNSAVYGSLGNIYTQQATNSYNFRLRHAYLQMGPWLFGQTWSTFMDIDNTPETVDFNGAIGSTFIRQPQIRYTYTTPTAGNFSGAIENSVSYVLDDKGAATTAGFSKVPDFVGRWDKSFQWGSVGVRAVSHEHRIDDGAGVSASRRGTGLAASGQIKTVGDDFISWIVAGGTGIGRYFNYVEGAAYDPVANRILMEKALGVVVGYQHKVSGSLRFNFVYGTQRNYDNEYTTFARANGFAGGQYGVNRRVSQLHIGGIWNPVKPVEIGAEWVFGRRETLLGEKGNMSRLNLLARYYFN